MNEMTTTKYLHRELGFKLSEFASLSNEDKDDLRRWARQEMEALGIPIKA